MTNALPNSDAESRQLPDGQYAIVECFGHTTLIGRIEEVERYGGKFLQIESLLNSQFLPARLIGNGAIYALTPITPEIAIERQAKSEWDLPVSLRAAILPAMLPAPVNGDDDELDPNHMPEFLQ